MTEGDFVQVSEEIKLAIYAFYSEGYIGSAASGWLTYVFTTNRAKTDCRIDQGGNVWWDAWPGWSLGIPEGKAGNRD